MIQILLNSLIEIVLCEYINTHTNTLVCKLCLNCIQMPSLRKCQTKKASFIFKQEEEQDYMQFKPIGLCYTLHYKQEAFLF